MEAASDESARKVRVYHVTMPETRSHQREVVLPIAPERAFKLLITPSDIRGWWGVNRAIVQPEQGGIWAATWGENEDDPDFITIATMRVFDPPRRILLNDYKYTAKTGPLPFKADLSLEFTVQAHADGTLLKVNNAGFPCDPVADGFFHGCDVGWTNTFDAMQRYVATL
jgi:uncharacterized protein YndB with AHSA1/START domain